MKIEIEFISKGSSKHTIYERNSFNEKHSFIRSNFSIRKKNSGNYKIYIGELIYWWEFDHKVDSDH